MTPTLLQFSEAGLTHRKFPEVATRPSFQSRRLISTAFAESEGRNWDVADMKPSGPNANSLANGRGFQFCLETTRPLSPPLLRIVETAPSRMTRVEVENVSFVAKYVAVFHCP